MDGGGWAVTVLSLDRPFEIIIRHTMMRNIEALLRGLSWIVGFSKVI